MGLNTFLKICIIDFSVKYRTKSEFMPMLYLGLIRYTMWLDYILHLISAGGFGTASVRLYDTF